MSLAGYCIICNTHLPLKAFYPRRSNASSRIVNECFNCLEAIEYAENMEDTCESCGDKTYDLCEFVNSKGETKIYCEPCVDYHTIMKSSLDDMMKIEKGGKSEKTYKELMNEVDKRTHEYLARLSKKNMKK